MLSFVAGPARAAPIQFPAFSGYVVDAAHVLPADTVAALTAKLGAFQKSSGQQVVVATIPSLGDEPIDDYGYRLGRAWGVGQKGKNSGAILIVAPADKKVRIEVGYGLEPVLTDAFSEQVIANDIVPAFKKGDIGGGVTAGVDAILTQLGADPAAASAAASTAATERVEARHRPHAGPGALFWLAIVVMWVAFSALRRGGGYGARPSSGLGSAILWGAAASMLDRRGEGGGGFFDGGGGGSDGGGFSGGGGGSFGGGGASGSW